MIASSVLGQRYTQYNIPSKCLVLLKTSDFTYSVLVCSLFDAYMFFYRVYHIFAISFHQLLNYNSMLFILGALKDISYMHSGAPINFSLNIFEISVLLGCFLILGGKKHKEVFYCHSLSFMQCSILV